MATTRFIPMHISKGQTIAQSLKDRFDYGRNPDKTKGGEYITSYECDPVTADVEFTLAKAKYKATTGREQKVDADVITYQMRQSFEPGEITPEEANRIGYELAMRWTKGRHAFIVTTHIDGSGKIGLNQQHPYSKRGCVDLVLFLFSRRKRGSFMATLDSVLCKAMELNWNIRSLLRLSTHKEYDDLSGLEINYEDAEQLFILDELRTVMDKLADAESMIEHLSKPIEETSRLFKNESGRYETRSGHYYTSGSGIEALVSDDYRDVPYWTRTSVEHDGKDYYLVGHREISLDGLTVRVRKAV